MRDSLTIRAATADDVDILRVLYHATWGYNRPRIFDHWRYVMSPDGLCPVTLAVDGERLVGAYSLWPARMKIGGEVVLGAQSMDTMTHPDYQGKGIFTRLAEACFDLARARGFRILYGFPNPLSYPGFVRRLGFPHVADVMHWVRPIRPSLHPRVPTLIGPLADAGMLLWPSGRRHAMEIRIGRPPDDELQKIIDASADEATCRVARSLAWLKWRYDAASSNNYRWICAYRSGELRGVGVWGMRDASWGGIADGRAHLVELMGDNAAALEAVLAAVIFDARAGRALLLETLSNIPPVEKALSRAGFLRHRKAPLIVKLLDDANYALDAASGSHWRIMGGDVDTF